MCSSTRLTLKCWDLHLFPPQPDLSDTGGGRTSSLRWSGQLCDMDLSLLVAFCSCVPPALASRMVEKDYDSAFHYGQKCPCKSSPKSRPSGVPEAEAGVVTGPQ
ncbi:uncharacterized protein LOC110511049 isoform X22 [Oncorhynchus mykiss]|uniref:uncharacterized protein LOC110511049 isoform X22 n=1 Tax=Oncorhynchus mykiss TaxID=8022 RepID=UPI001878C730|nr:uncharacterized protein LOC110511049 isoform X22 [Oncorhynchus mykiss]